MLTPGGCSGVPGPATRPLPSLFCDAGLGLLGPGREGGREQPARGGVGLRPSEGDD